MELDHLYVRVAPHPVHSMGVAAEQPEATKKHRQPRGLFALQHHSTLLDCNSPRGGRVHIPVGA